MNAFTPQPRRAPPAFLDAAPERPELWHRHPRAIALLAQLSAANTRYASHPLEPLSGFEGEARGLDADACDALEELRRMRADALERACGFPINGQTIGEDITLAEELSRRMPRVADLVRGVVR